MPMPMKKYSNADNVYAGPTQRTHISQVMKKMNTNHQTPTSNHGLLIFEHRVAKRGRPQAPSD